MMKGLEAREHSIHQAVEEAHKAREETARLRDEVLRERAKAAEEARAMIEQARRDAQKQADELQGQGTIAEIFTSERDRMPSRPGAGAATQALQGALGADGLIASKGHAGVEPRAIGRRAEPPTTTASSRSRRSPTSAGPAPNENKK